MAEEAKQAVSAAKAGSKVDRKMLLIIGIVAIVIVAVLGAGFMMMGGSLGAGSVNITSDAQAKSTVTDVGTDISGINNTLSEIDQTLSGA